MNDLIKVKFDETSDTMPTISGRELHQALEVQTQYTKWFSRMCEYGFTENSDFQTVVKNVYRADGTLMPQPSTDHALSIEMAKELCMIQRTPKGKECREYFLEIERKWNSPEAVMARALKMADVKLLEATQKITVLEAKVQEQKTDIERMKPKEVFADAVADSDGAILIRELAKVLVQNGIKTGEKKLYAWLRDNGYLIKHGSDRNSPTQMAVEMGLFYVKKSVRVLPTGEKHVDSVTKVTGKGQIYFLNKGKKLGRMDGER